MSGNGIAIILGFVFLIYGSFLIRNAWRDIKINRESKVERVYIEVVEFLLPGWTRRNPLVVGVVILGIGLVLAVSGFFH